MKININRQKNITISLLTYQKQPLTGENRQKIILAICKLLKYNNTTNLLQILGVTSDKSPPLFLTRVISNTGKEKYSNSKWKERPGKLFA